MSDRLSWGILGTGTIAHLFARDLTIAGFTVKAVGSRDIQSARDFVEGGSYGVEFTIPNIHGSYESLVADPEVDIVYVASPNPFHAEHASLGLNAGKHVLVEKPFTMNRAEAEAVVALAASRDRVVLEGMWTRWLPHMARIRELVSLGTLGELRTLIADNDDLLSADPLHRVRNPALGGGALLDLGVYPVSFAVDIFGLPTTLAAAATMTETRVDEQTAIILGFEGQRQALIHTALGARGPRRASIIGTQARIEIDSAWYTATGFSVIASDGTTLERYESAVEGRGMQFQAAELERLVRAGEFGGEVLPPAESVAIMGVLDEIRSQIGLGHSGTT